MARKVAGREQGLSDVRHTMRPPPWPPGSSRVLDIVSWITARNRFESEMDGWLSVSHPRHGVVPLIRRNDAIKLPEAVHVIQGNG